MRTTITLTPEADGLIRRLMAKRALSFKEAVNEAIIRGLADDGVGRVPYTLPAFHLGVASHDLDHAMDVLAEFDSDFGRFPGVHWETPPASSPA